MFSRKKLFIAVTGLVSLGLLATLAPLVSLGQNTPIDTRKSFYLTKATHKGFAGETACALGYHMASLWEIHEPSNLSYNTTLGLTGKDTGQGPPSGLSGWIRTGYGDTTEKVIGSNCYHYTSGDAYQFGSAAHLAIFPTQQIPLSDYFGISTSWYVAAITCNTDLRLWCVQNSAGIQSVNPLP